MFLFSKLPIYDLGDVSCNGLYIHDSDKLSDWAMRLRLRRSYPDTLEGR